jgi:hypothetical protein
MLSFVSHKCGTHGVNSNCWPKYRPNDTVRFVCGVCVFVSGLPLLFSSHIMIHRHTALLHVKNVL